MCNGYAHIGHGPQGADRSRCVKKDRKRANSVGSRRVCYVRRHTTAVKAMQSRQIIYSLAKPAIRTTGWTKQVVGWAEQKLWA